MKIAISADLSTVKMRKGAWSQSIPAADLPKWITLYERLRDRLGGRYAQHYAQDVIDMRAAQKRLSGKIN